MTSSQTPLIEIRTFLGAHRASVPPWMSASGTVEALYVTLQTHRDDAEFWLALKKLCIGLEGHLISPAAAVNCDVLRHATVSQILDDLQRELQQKKSATAFQAWVKTPIIVTALAGFLFLGCATLDDNGEDENTDDSSTTADSDDTGEDENTDDSSSPTDSDDNGDGTPTDSVSLTDDELETCDIDAVDEENCADYVQLLQVVKEADIWEGTQDDLLACLPELDAEFRAEMLDAFENFDDDEIASYLTNLTDSGQVCFDDDDIGGH